MASMSYCVFENTYSDFCTCVHKIRKREEVNQYEKPYQEMLYEAAQEYIKYYEQWREDNFEVVPDEDEEDEY